MKKLIVALFASATALLASAKVRTTDFEDDSLGLFSGSEGGVITNYTTSSAAYFPYPCGGVGSYYCEIDADNASFASSNTLGAAFCYFDMNVQFTTRADGDSVSIDNAKIAVFLNGDGKIAVLAGASAQDYTNKTTYVTDTTLLNGDWARLTAARLRAQRRPDSLIGAPAMGLRLLEASFSRRLGLVGVRLTRLSVRNTKASGKTTYAT